MQKQKKAADNTCFSLFSDRQQDDSQEDQEQGDRFFLQVFIVKPNPADRKGYNAIAAPDEW